MVEKVCHLTSGYVSPQFHVICDNRFHTLYGAGRKDTITNTICNLLWANDHEIYAEDKCGPDGTFIYTPPPLDKVWLDEEGVRDQRNCLITQHHHVEQEFCTKSQAVPTPTKPDDTQQHNRHPVISEDSFKDDCGNGPKKIMIFQPLLLPSLNQREMPGPIMVAVAWCLTVAVVMAE